MPFGADSLARRLAKRALYPLMNESVYSYVQAAAKALDIRRGAWTEPELDLLPLALRPGESALDIGANFGLYTYHLARILGPSGQVFAFEPIPFTFQTLQKVARLLGLTRGVYLFSKGCGEAPGELVFSLPVQDSGAISAGLAHLGSRNDAREGKSQHARYQQYREVRCPVVRIDEELPGISPALLKCDIEGADLFALRGAVKTIERSFPVVICEINPWFLEGFGLSVPDLLTFFYTRDYSLYRYDEISPGQRRLVEVRPGQVVEDNYVFVHPSRRDRLAPLLDH
jgi:FkbM family methyltransferase